MNVFVQGASRGLGLAFVRKLLADPSIGDVFAASRTARDRLELRRLSEIHPNRLHLLQLDATKEDQIRQAAKVVAERCRLHLLLNVAGLLHDEGMNPEKKLQHVMYETLVRSFSVNAFAPLLVAKHFVPLLVRDDRAIIANISARVGSITDNRLGGWYAYRASKAAQNMFTRTIAIELNRRAVNAICVALHPGTVDTSLSRPFQSNVPANNLFPPDRAAEQLLTVLNGLNPADSGKFFAWDGSTIPW